MSTNNQSNSKKIENRPGFLKNQQFVVVLILLLMIGFFWIMSPGFRQYTTVLSIFDYSYYMAFIAMGVTFCLVTGGVDLSIGTGLICSCLIGGHCIVHLGIPPIVGILITISIGFIIGTMNGILVGYLDLPPFIATLGTMMIARGMGGGITVTWPDLNSPQGWVRKIFGIVIGERKIPTGIIWILLIGAVMSIVLQHTSCGRYIKAVGSNKEAAKLSGIRVSRYLMIAYMISGFFTGLSGVAYGTTFMSITSGLGGGFELDAIAASVIGGVSISGGDGSIWGTLLGVCFMSVLKTGLPFIGLKANWQQIIIGVILVIAVFVDVKKRARD